jgi:S-ribosylhomocysteine lyase
MKPPHLRVTADYTTPHGDHVYRWDLRLTQPNSANQDHFDWPQLHSLEHFLGAALLARTDLGDGRAVVQVGPMGCGTGLYLTTIGIGDVDTFGDLIASILEDVLDADTVPLANVVRCGRADLHDLEGAQAIASYLLGARDEWADMGPDAREIEEGEGA